MATAAVQQVKGFMGLEEGGQSGGDGFDFESMSVGLAGCRSGGADFAGQLAPTRRQRGAHPPATTDAVAVATISPGRRASRPRSSVRHEGHAFTRPPHARTPPPPTSLPAQVRHQAVQEDAHHRVCQLPGAGLSLQHRLHVHVGQADVSAAAGRRTGTGAGAVARGVRGLPVDPGLNPAGHPPPLLRVESGAGAAVARGASEARVDPGLGPSPPRPPPPRRRSFALLYTFGNLIALIGTGFLVGFLQQLKNMADKSRRIASLLYLVSLVGTLLAVFLIPNATAKFFVAIMCIVVQFLCLVWYTGAWGRGLRGGAGMSQSVAAGVLQRCVL